MKRVIVFGLIFYSAILSYFFVFKTEINSDHISNLLLFPYYFRDKVYLPSDNFMIKYPFYSLVVSLIGINLWSIFAISFFCLLLTHGLYWWFYKKVILLNNVDSKWWAYVPMTTVIFGGWNLMLHLVHPHLRNIEIGLLFYILSLFIFGGKLKPKLVYLLIAVLILVFFSDPYYLAVFAAPVIISALIIYYQKHDSRYLLISLIVYVAALGGKILEKGLVNTGLFAFDSVRPQISLEAFINNFSHFIPNLHTLVRPGFSAVLNFSTSNIISSLSLAGVIISLLMLGYYFWQGFCKSDFLKLYLGSSAFILIGVTLFSQLGSFGLYRYYIYLFFLIPTMWLMVISDLWKQKKLIIMNFLLAIFLISALFNTVSFYSVLWQRRTVSGNEDNWQLLKQLKDQNLKYGYATFWNASINTYLSSDVIKVRPVHCINYQIMPYYRLSTINWYEFAIHHGETFLLLNHKDLRYGCSFKTIKSQFGKPSRSKTIIFKNQMKFTLLIYDYNIGQVFN